MEVDVQDREQVDSEREKVEARDKEKGDKTRTNNAQTHDIMDGMWMERMRTSDILSHDVSVITCARCMRKTTCEVYLSTHLVGYSGSIATVNETNCNKKNSDQFQKKYELISNSIQTCPTTMCLKRDAIVCIDLEV